MALQDEFRNIATKFADSDEDMANKKIELDRLSVNTIQGDGIKA